MKHSYQLSAEFERHAEQEFLHIYHFDAERSVSKSRLIDRKRLIKIIKHMIGGEEKRK
jgi:hypothetical protein